MESFLANNNEITNWGFLVFLVCFFINVFLIGRSFPQILSMVDNLFHKKERQSIFFIQGNYGSSEKFLMLFQSALLSGILLFCFRRQLEPDFPVDLKTMFLYVGVGILLFILFFGYKFLTYQLIGFSFFTKEQNQIWNGQFISILCLSGIFLFVPALLFFFVNRLSFVCFYLILIYLTFVFLFVVYTIYRIFFQDKVPSLYFILYLCTQEIAPMYILYMGSVYFL
jgi:hypothetical protein